jgi:FkbM family methyltransferase
MEVGHGTVVSIDFADYMSLWCLVCDHERDPAYKLSLDLVLPGSVVFDVGANIGLWALPAAALAGPRGAVHAFEPVPKTFAALVEHVGLNDLENVHCNRVALSDSSGARTIYAATEANTGASGFMAREAAAQAIETKSMTLDEYCDSESVGTIDLLKIDVEGAELLVLRGASQQLESDSGPAIVFEVDAGLMASFGWSQAGVVLFLENHGYSVYWQDRGRLVPVSTDSHAADHGDLFALKPRHFQRYPALQ